MMPLYLSLLFKVAKAEGTHEGCIEQVYRLYRDGICGPAPLRDEEGRLRVDDWELAPAVRRACRNCGTRSRPTTSTH